MNAIIRLAVYESTTINTCVNKEYSWANILVGLWANLATTFAEIRLKKLHCWLTPAAATNAPGMMCVVLAPASEFKLTNQPKFTNLGCAPGSVVRKVYQSAHREWHPTSPFEKGWHPVTSTDGLFHLVFMTNGMQSGGGINANSLPYELVLDFHIAARGIDGGKFMHELFPQQLEEFTPSLDSMAIGSPQPHRR